MSDTINDLYLDLYERFYLLGIHTTDSDEVFPSALHVRGRSYGAGYLDILAEQAWNSPMYRRHRPELSTTPKSEVPTQKPFNIEPRKFNLAQSRGDESASSRGAEMEPVLVRVGNHFAMAVTNHRGDVVELLPIK